MNSIESPEQQQDQSSVTLQWLHRLSPLISLAFFGIALWFAHQEIVDYHIDDITELLFSAPPRALLLALLCTAGSYTILACYDLLGLRHVGHSLSLPKVMLASFTGFAVSNNVGHALISGGSLRYRFYSGWGLNGVEIASIVLFGTITYFLAVGSLLLSSYWFAPSDLLAHRPLAGASVDWLMGGIALGLAAYWALVLSGRRQLRWRENEISLPSPGLTLAQTLLGMLDLFLAGLVLYVLLAAQTDIPFSVFLNAYLLAQLLGLFSQIPGGLGVFEGAFLYLLAPAYPAAEVLSSLMLYRVIYYFLPLGAAGVAMVAYEVRAQQLLKRPAARIPVAIVRRSIPQVLSALLMVAGGILLFSGTTPGQEDRLEALADLLSLPMIETSHLAGSIIGLLMLVLARGVRLRINTAYYGSLILLALGIVASLAKGIDYEEAALLTTLFLLFLPSRGYFYRKSKLTQMELSSEWLALVAIIVALSTWLGFFSYKHVEYSHELWWQFSLHGDASRFLRSTFALAVLGIAGVFYRLMFHLRVDMHPPTPEELDRAKALVSQGSDTQPYLALTGDKYLLWSESGQGFLSFGISNRYWIAMGDPLGSPDDQEELVWKFREEADRHGARIAFYQVSANTLPLYLDLGLSLIKLGEEARVDLGDFSLEGRKRGKLRQAYNKYLREGCSFEIVPREQVPALIPRLKEISDSWLSDKNTREKSFSLGFFDPAYLTRGAVAVVKLEEQIVAFANLWELDNREELSIDLMRYTVDAPSGTMEFLNIALMLWGKEQGYRWFNLGMAPLSGLEHHPLAPIWHKVGSTVFRHGNEFYNFTGLHQYKDKFDPIWMPRYLAAPAGLNLPSVLLRITTLISGGLKGVFTK